MFAALRETMQKTLGSAGPPPSEMALSTVDSCRAEMGSCFADVAVHPVSHLIRFPSVTALWESMERSMVPILMMRRGVGEERWAPLSEAARSAIARVVGEGPVQLTMNAWLTVGVSAP
jgi:hypothetical protein